MDHAEEMSRFPARVVPEQKIPSQQTPCRFRFLLQVPPPLIGWDENLEPSIEPTGSATCASWRECSCHPLLSNTKRHALPSETMRPTPGVRKCAVITSVSVAAKRSRKARRAARALAASVQKQLFQSGSAH